MITSELRFELVRWTIIGVSALELYTKSGILTLQSGSERCISHSARRGNPGFPSIQLQILHPIERRCLFRPAALRDSYSGVTIGQL